MIATGGRRTVLRVLQLTGLADAVTVDPVAVKRLATAGKRTATRVTPRGSARRRARPVYG